MIKFIAFINNISTKYKRKHMHDVVQNYAQLVHDQITLSAPIAAGLIGALGMYAVNKTMANPKPLADLLVALDSCIQHYAPECKEIFNAADWAMTDTVSALKPKWMHLSRH